MIERLRMTLVRVHALTGKDFAGIGLIVHRPAARLPIFPLRPHGVAPEADDLEHSLALVASRMSDLHDGFHLLSVDWQITAVAQYFSPPVVADLEINWKRKFGGRYLAAQFGSTLPGVEFCGIATTSLGIAIFKDGREIHFEKL